MNNHRKKLFILITVLSLLGCFFGSAAADVSNIWVLGAFPSEPAGIMDVYFKAADSNNAFSMPEKDKLSFRVDNSITLDHIQSLTKSEGISYIFVVDCSACYYQSDNEFVSAALSSCVKGMRSQDNAFFITMDNKSTESNGYITREQAIEYASKLTFPPRKYGRERQDIQAPLWDGVYVAGDQAAKAGDGAKPIKVVMIFTDAADWGKGQTIDQVLTVFGNCRATPVYCFVAADASDSSKNSATDYIVKGREGLNRLKNQNGGNYYAVNSIDAGNEYASQAVSEVQSILCATVDIVPLFEGDDREYSVDLIYDGEKKVSVSTSVRINRGAIPSPTPAPETKDPDVMYTWEELAARPADLNKIQTALAEAHYLENRSGELDNETKQAIFDFCDRNNCKKTNEGISRQAWDTINSGKYQAKATPAPTEQATRNPEIVFSLDDGFENNKQMISIIQDRLKLFYYLDPEDYQREYGDTEGPATLAAMNAFCYDNSIDNTKGFPKAAYDLLMSDGVRPARTPEPEATATPSPTPTPEPTVKPGLVLQLNIAANNTGLAIKVQTALVELKYLEENSYTQGEYDAPTHQAVLRFCKKNQIPESDDGLTQDAYDLLNSGNALPYVEEQATPTPAPTILPGLALQLNFPANDAGTVIQVQNALAELGYLTENYTKGDYDASTHQAVLRFCKKNSIQESKDGLAQDAYVLLISGEALPFAEEQATPTPVPTAHPFEPDMADSVIADYQNRLNELGYYEGNPYTPGRFDEATQKAQDRFCEVNNIEKQRGASVELQQTVMESKTRNEKRPLLERVRNGLTGNTEIAGLMVPVWILTAMVVLLTVAAIFIIVKLIRSREKNDTGSEMQPASLDDNILPGDRILPGSREETVELSDGDGNLDMTVVGDSRNITLRIDYNGSSVDKAYELGEGMPLVIGRGTEADIRTNKDDMRISRKHGQFIYRNGSVFYRDTSKAGTLIDGRMIHEEETEISNGTTLHLSNHIIKVQM